MYYFVIMGLKAKVYVFILTHIISIIHKTNLQAMVLQQPTLTPRLHTAEQILHWIFSGTAAVIFSSFLKMNQ